MQQKFELEAFEQFGQRRRSAFRLQSGRYTRRIVIQIVKYLLNDRRVFDTGESLPRERSECFGYDPDITTTFTAGAMLEEIAAKK